MHADFQGVLAMPTLYGGISFPCLCRYQSRYGLSTLTYSVILDGGASAKVFEASALRTTNLFTAVAAQKFLDPT